jgi:hypothetical protein
MTGGSARPREAPGEHAVQSYDPPGGPRSSVIATRTFPPELGSVRAARHVTARVLDEAPESGLADDAAIVVTELAANAVLHARTGFTLTIARSASGVTIAVRDGRPLTPGRDGRRFDVKAGHGLSVVAQVARAWAVEAVPEGKVVWAELPVPVG